MDPIPSRNPSILYINDHAPNHPPHERLSRHEVLHLLQQIEGLNFDDVTYAMQIENALTELAWWDPNDHDDELAIAWIKRIYPEVEKLSIDHRFYGKALRRLRTLCGRTTVLPPLFEVTDGFKKDAGGPKFCTRGSDIYMAKNDSKVVALKAIRASQNENESLRILFRKEAIAWQLLRHPHIVPFLGILRPSSTAQSVELVSVWMKHGQLTDYLKKNPGTSPLPFIRHVISGLSHIHGLGMAHADIKAPNILVDDGLKARIADFGVTVPIQFTGVHTQPGSRGTVAYKAPELIDDGMDDAPWTGLPTRESDIFAMGVLIWEVFALEQPHKNRNDFSINNMTLKGKRLKRSDAPSLLDSWLDPLWTIVERAWSQSAQDRCTLLEMDEVVVGLLQMGT